MDLTRNELIVVSGCVLLMAIRAQLLWKLKYFDRVTNRVIKRQSPTLSEAFTSFAFIVSKIALVFVFATIVSHDSSVAYFIAFFGLYMMLTTVDYRFSRQPSP